MSFRYPGTDTDVLVDVDLRLASGSVVAVVGENGAGKSTLVKLLLGCYPPTQGRITVEDVDLRRVDVDEWRRHVSAGFQDFVRFQLVLREAVGVGDLERIDDEAAVLTALKRSQASDLAGALPAGLESQLGREVGAGTELSEGQWQKVAIARSLMAYAPLLLVLDEPTSGPPGRPHRGARRWPGARAGNPRGARRRRRALRQALRHPGSCLPLSEPLDRRA